MNQESRNAGKLNLEGFCFWLCGSQIQSLSCFPAFLIQSSV